VRIVAEKVATKRKLEIIKKMFAPTSKRPDLMKMRDMEEMMLSGSLARVATVDLSSAGASSLRMVAMLGK